ncbi:hypothetical protein [Sulfuricurvum sp.]|uniref:hypothetical protein n=1 Tax=Sulfuricurvum sp. TaxID=2025608 RepID=UPI002624C601|nr:hypothetical protein [Sulfuricurvum sp.]MDD4883690.1 hypothetical protein [Sulfuricurvum sp.]
MDFNIWSFFLSLESDLIDTTKYVHFSEENFKTFSSQYSKIILTSASEFESVAKIFIRVLDSEKKSGNIGEIKKSLLSEFPNIHKNIVTIARYGIEIRPFDNWENEGKLTWWDAYINIKHDRNKNFQEANLENALNALSALLVLNVYYYRYLYKYQHLSGNKLLDMAGMGVAIICAPSNDLDDEIK